MALLDLDPKINACVTNSCSTLRVYDTTQPLSVDYPDGWGVATVVPSQISKATITILNPNNETFEFIITSTVTAQTTVTGSFLLGDFTIPPVDGEYKITYTLETRSGVRVTTSVSTCVFSLCVVRCCVDSLWKQVAINALSEDCNCSHEKTSALEKAEIAEGVFNAIKFGVACGSTDIKNELLKKLQKICKLEKCNCN